MLKTPINDELSASDVAGQTAREEEDRGGRESHQPAYHDHRKFVDAIEEGSTMVRLGSLIFGERE